MPVISLDLTRFSFERNDPTWSGPIEVDLSWRGSCKVLTGENAGGKTLILKSLEKFTRLLCDPNRESIEDFEDLVRAAGVKNISATYSGRWWSKDGGFPLPHDWYDVEVDLNKFCRAAGRPKGSYKFHPAASEELFSLHTHLNLETRCNIDGTDISYERRIGIKVDAEADAEENQDPDGGEPTILRELVFGEWKKIFPSYQMDESPRRMSRLWLELIEQDRMWSFLNNENFIRLKNRTGIFLNDSASAEQHGNDGYFDEDRRFQFVPRVAKFLSVDEAYRMSTARRQALLQATRVMSSAESANQRLKTSYDDILERKKTEVYAEEEDQDLPANVKALVRTNFEVYGTGPHLLRSENYWEEVGSYRPPTVIIFDNGEIDFIQTMATHGPSMRKIDPELAFWFAMYGFFGASLLEIGKQKDRPPYFSSGQSRIVSMLSSIQRAPEDSTILIDEPELSLHFEWQRNLIDVISGNLRLVIATHSPDIVYNHTEKIVEVPPSSEV